MIIKTAYNKFRELKTLIIAILFISVPCTIFSQSPDEIFHQGNKFYQDKDYNSAIKLYDSLNKIGYKSINLYFNLGNSYYKLKKYPAAILYYEKAKLLGGIQDDIEHNLNIANLNVVDKIEPLPQLFYIRWWNSFVNFYSSEVWAKISLVLLWISFSMIIVFVFIAKINIRRVSFLLFLIIFLMTIFSTLIANKRYNYETSHDFAIVFTPIVYVKSAPDEESTDQFIIHEGLKVYLMDNIGDWQQIRLADGKVGWLKKDTIEII